MSTHDEHSSDPQSPDLESRDQHSLGRHNPAYQSPAVLSPDWQRQEWQSPGPQSPGRHHPDQQNPDQSNPDQSDPDQHHLAQHHPDQQTPHDQGSPRQARHRSDVELPGEPTPLPAWAAEVPERGYYDAEVRSPEWVRARGLGLVPDLPEATAEHPEDRAGSSIERGRVFPTTYRETFVFSA